MKKIIIALTLCGALAFSSCKSLEVAPPNSLTDEQMRELLATGSEDKVNTIIEAIGTGLETYMNFSGNYTGYSSYPQNSQIDQEFIRSMLGNDVVMGAITSNTGTHRTWYELNVDLQNPSTTAPFWDMPVDFYTKANYVLKYITADVVERNPALGSYRANALVVRAWGYLNLIERFQPAYAQNPNAAGLPIYTEYRVNPVAPISSAKEVYEKIISWLEEAIKLYDGLGIGYTDDNDDFDKGVAQYLLMRAALEFTDYDKVIAAGKEITAKYTSFIAEKNYGVDIADVDAIGAGIKEFPAEQNAFHCQAVNPEVILSFNNGSGRNKGLTWSFANIFAPGEAGYGLLPPCIDTRLLDKMDDNDFRKARFLDHPVDYEYTYEESSGSKATRTILKYATTKWGATKALGESKRNEQSKSDDILIRSSEVYLMLAEAYAQTNNATDAENTLNKLLAARTKAGKPTLTCSNYKGMGSLSALQKVQLQTRIEMWLEKGLEFYNNKRWGIDVDRTGTTNHYSTVTSLPVAKMTTAVPVSEQTANPNWAKVK